MTSSHEELAAGGWRSLSLLEQLGNIGSEVGRMARWKGRDEEKYRGAESRAMELFDFTISDPRWRGRLKEINRARAVFLDACEGGREFGGTLESLERYFMHFAMAARKDR